MSKDLIPRYAPEKIFKLGFGELPIQSYVSYPPGKHPEGCPLRKDLTALEMRTEAGSRWYGFERAWINSELRMVVSGFSSLDEFLMTWEPCKVP